MHTYIKADEFERPHDVVSLDLMFVECLLNRYVSLDWIVYFLRTMPLVDVYQAGRILLRAVTFKTIISKRSIFVDMEYAVENAS